MCRAVPRPARRRLGRSAALAFAAVLAASGCAAGTPVPTSSALSPAPTFPAPTVPVPAGGVSLADLGFRNGPAERVTLPAGVRLGLRLDQPHMLTATFTAPDGAVIAAWLRAHLGDGGFRITADGAGGIVFEGHGWRGAFTGVDAGSALTLRRGG